jgi:hypothetical protein
VLVALFVVAPERVFGAVVLTLLVPILLLAYRSELIAWRARRRADP